MKKKAVMNWLFGDDAKWIPTGCVLFAISFIMLWIMSE